MITLSLSPTGLPHLAHDHSILLTHSLYNEEIDMKVKVETEAKYAECCTDTKNWANDGEVVCTKCGRVLTDEVAILVLA